MNDQWNMQDDDWRNKDVFDPKPYKEFLDYARGAALFAILTIIGVGVFYLADKSLIGGYWTNIVSTVLGAVLTIVILDKRNDYRAEHEFKERLILQLGSPYRSFSEEALRLLRLKEWLYDGTLEKANLTKAVLQNTILIQANLSKAYMLHANLEGSNLREANLEGCYLFEANLQESNLQGANLKKSNLWGANLHRANLKNCDLSASGLVAADLSFAMCPNTDLQETHLKASNFEHAQLYKANLENADLQGANLSGTKLRDANMKKAQLKDVLFSIATVLPDNSRWTPDRDMREFTHPEEWQSEHATKQSDNAT